MLPFRGVCAVVQLSCGPTRRGATGESNRVGKPHHQELISSDPRRPRRHGSRRCRNTGTSDRGTARVLPRRSSPRDRKSTRLNSSHTVISYAVFCLKKKKKNDVRKTYNGHRRGNSQNVTDVHNNQ